MVSPPVPFVRGRNMLTAGRYATPDKRENFRRLNAEVECISRVVVHPAYRGCGLAGALVRHALVDARTPYVEALAAMGAVHPLFERAGMTPCRMAADRYSARLLSAAQAAGLSRAELADASAVRRVLAGGGAKSRFLRREIRYFIAHKLRPSAPRRRARVAGATGRSGLAQCGRDARVTRHSDAALAYACRHATRQYVYYLGRTGSLVN